MKQLRIILVVVLAAMVTGCASIVSKSDWPVSITSSPDGADFNVTNKNGTKVHSGRTPAILVLSSKAGYFSGETYTIKYKKEGYKEIEETVDTELNGWYLGNIIFGGVIIGMLIVDPLTGAMWRLPEYVSGSLELNK